MRRTGVSAVAVHRRGSGRAASRPPAGPAGLHDERRLDAWQQGQERSIGNGQSVMGRKSPPSGPCARSYFTAPLARLGGSVQGHRDDVGVLAEVEVGALFVSGHARVLLVQADDVPPGRRGGGGSKIRLRRWQRSPKTAQSGMPGSTIWRASHPPRHLAEVPVADDDDRVAVPEGELEGEQGDVEHLLRRRRREHEGVGIAVTEPPADELRSACSGPILPSPDRPA